jgi:hypothetical protein
LMFALRLHLYVGPVHFASAVSVALMCAAGGGLLAARYGDAFWHAVISCLRG